MAVRCPPSLYSASNSCFVLAANFVSFEDDKKKAMSAIPARILVRNVSVPMRKAAWEGGRGEMTRGEKRNKWGQRGREYA